METWRERAKPLIRKLIEENSGLSNKELAKIALKAFPWRPRMYHPYKVWCDEVRSQLGTKKIKPRKPRKTSTSLAEDAPGQIFFEFIDA